MKRLWFKYITDLRISILFILLINMLSYCLSGIIPFSCFEGRPKYASHLDHFLLSEEQRSVNAFLSGFFPLRRRLMRAVLPNLRSCVERFPARSICPPAVPSMTAVLWLARTAHGRSQNSKR